MLKALIPGILLAGRTLLGLLGKGNNRAQSTEEIEEMRKRLLADIDALKSKNKEPK